MIAPCHECTERTAIPNCHVTCERYQAYNAERELIRIQRQRQNAGMDAQVRQAERRKMSFFKQRRK